MRIIAGTYGSRRLEAPPGLNTRPSSDRLRETLFNVLAPRMDGAAFLDLYAGSGAVGLEALSRGAERVTFVERSPRALKVLRRNLERLGIESGFAVRAESVAAFLRSAAKASAKPHEGAKPGRYEVVFLDPPYDAAEEYAATLGVLGEAQGILAPGGAGDRRAPAQAEPERPVRQPEADAAAGTGRCCVELLCCCLHAAGTGARAPCVIAGDGCRKFCTFTCERGHFQLH